MSKGWHAELEEILKPLALSEEEFANVANHLLILVDIGGVLSRFMAFGAAVVRSPSHLRPSLAKGYIAQLIQTEHIVQALISKDEFLELKDARRSPSTGEGSLTTVHN
jgi:hypothetical protein